MISNVFTYYNTDKGGSQLSSSSLTSLSHHHHHNHQQSTATNNTNATNQPSKPQANKMDEEEEEETCQNDSKQMINSKPIDIATVNSHSQPQSKTSPKTTKTTAPANTATIKTQQVSASESYSPLNSSSSQLYTQNKQQQQQQQSNICSSMPSSYGSYINIYKRLMRSLSSSLISGQQVVNATGTAVNSLDEDESTTNSTGKESLSSLFLLSTSFGNKSQTQQRRTPLLLPTASNLSSQVAEPSQTSAEPIECQKCVRHFAKNSI